MASQPISHPNKTAQPHATPNCNDPNCEYCKDLREVQESIRLHKPLPSENPKENSGAL